MASYADWGRSEVPLLSILLDAENPRLPDNDEGLTQNQILDLLLEKKFKLLDLAASIASIGYTPLDNIIVFEDEATGEYVVLEGNRRIAALKLLLNPSLARNPKIEKRLIELSGQITHAEKVELGSVTVVIAPSRRSADRVLMSRHTMTVVEPWSPAMQAKFVFERSQDIGFDKTQNELNIGRDKLEEFISRYYFYELTKQILGREFDSSTFSFSTMERVLRNGDARDYFGLIFSDDGKFYIETEVDYFLSIFTRLVSDIHSKVINSRNLNTSQEILSWINLKKKPNKAKRKTPFSKLLGAKKRKKKSSPPKPKPKKTNYFLPSDLQVDGDNPRLKSVVEELQKMPLNRYPNGIAVLARTFIEISCALFIQDKNEVANYKKFIAKKGGKDKLSLALSFLADPSRKLLDGKLCQAVGQFKNKSQFNSLPTVQEYTHNHFLSPTESDLRDLWTTIEPFIRHILKRD